MKHQGKWQLFTGMGLVALFAILTWLVQTVDVQPLGVNGTDIGFCTINSAFHELCDVHMTLYTITDWAGIVPIAVALSFAVKGLVQLIRRKSLFKVDGDILLLGVHFIILAALYVIFEMNPINYRPILIDGNLEASYPSSTTLLVLSVMPTLKYQTDRRIANPVTRKAIRVFIFAFSLFIVSGRTISGVHWATDIVGSVFLSTGLYLIYRFIAEYSSQKKMHRRSEASNGVQ